MIKLGVSEGSDLWDRVIRITTRYGLKETLGDFYPTPSSLAAGAIYVSCRIEEQPRTQHTVSDAVNVSNMAIRNCYKAIIDAEGYDMGSSPGPWSGSRNGSGGEGA